MVSATEVGDNKTPNSKANWNKNKPKPGHQVLKFSGAATSDNVLHGKVKTTGANQDGQLITLVKAIPSYIGTNHYADWTESFCSMTQKAKANFMTTAPRKQDYGMVDALDVFYWQVPTLDTKEDYNRVLKIWDRNLTAEIKQWIEYVNNGEYLFLTIQGQVEMFLCDKTKDNTQFAAIQTLKCPIALTNLMKERSTGTMNGVCVKILGKTRILVLARVNH